MDFVQHVYVTTKREVHARFDCRERCMQDLIEERCACMINIIERGACGAECQMEVYVGSYG
jgi:hypothetical protein